MQSPMEQLVLTTEAASYSLQRPRKSPSKSERAENKVRREEEKVRRKEIKKGKAKAKAQAKKGIIFI